MKRFLFSLTLSTLTLAACAPRGQMTPSGQATGAASPRAAVEQFLAAVRAQDIQAMSVVWGTEHGPAREVVDPAQLERRVIIMQCFLDHESYRLLAETPGEGGRRTIRVELRRGNDVRTPQIYTIRGPSNRWYVENIEIAAVRDFCGTPLPSNR